MSGLLKFTAFSSIILMAGTYIYKENSISFELTPPTKKLAQVNTQAVKIPKARTSEITEKSINQNPSSSQKNRGHRQYSRLRN